MHNLPFAGSWDKKRDKDRKVSGLGGFISTNGEKWWGRSICVYANFPCFVEALIRWFFVLLLMQILLFFLLLDDHGNSNGSHVKIFLPKKLLECLPKCSSLPKERHRWNTNEVIQLLCVFAA